jgi:hypothetical protein
MTLHQSHDQAEILVSFKHSGVIRLHWYKPSVAVACLQLLETQNWGYNGLFPWFAAGGMNNEGPSGSFVFLCINMMLKDVCEQNIGHAIYSYEGLCMHVHAMVPGQHVYDWVMQRRRASSRRYKMRTCLLRKKTLKERHRSFSVRGAWSRVHKPR